MAGEGTLQPKGWVLTFLFVFAFFIALTLVLFITVYNEQPGTYMDEVFHVVQTHHYCSGNFHRWNSKITTPPGLYLLTMILLTPVAVISGRPLHMVCSVLSLRFINVLFSFGNFYLIYLLFRKLSKCSKDKSMLLIIATLNLSILPVLYFFSFIYYTDAGSLFFVLVMYILHCHQKENLASFAGFVAITFRQTNVIWVFFVAAETALSIVIKHLKQKHKIQHDFHQLFEVTKSLTALFVQEPRRFFQLFSEVYKTCKGYICVGVLFMTFVIFNNGIVLGDRAAHQACFHLPQLFYFLGFCSFFTLTSFITKTNLKRFVKFAKSHAVQLCIAGAVIFIGIYYFTHVHKYLLADNRHLTFYIWKRILNRPDGLHFVFIPVYIYSAWVMNDMLCHKDFLWKVIFYMCIFVAVVPQKLFELRYFIIPYIMFRLNSPLTECRQLVMESMLYVVVNLFTFYLFMYKTFYWSEGDKQRIMW